ncbi:hypothetical protein NKH16_24360 [Mesorhizobium sp. M1307]|uniref:hypothetical protein n=1 Tax=Mesorhizobium sp. M1307 TaxID=2957079 RepID=UPI00333BDC04
MHSVMVVDHLQDPGGFVGQMESAGDSPGAAARRPDQIGWDEPVSVIEPLRQVAPLPSAAAGSSTGR